MIKGNYFTNNKDLMFHFEKNINWEQLIRTYENDFEDNKTYQKTKSDVLSFAPSNVEEAKEIYLDTMKSVGDIAGNYVAPAAAQMDKEGLKYDNGKVIFPEVMKECFEKAKEAGLLPYSLSRHYGGLNLPNTMHSMILETMSRADSAFTLAFGASNIAEIMEACASEEILKEWLTKVTNGDMISAMSLTEPNYGSDLSNVKTKATKDKDGNWYLTGTKRFITHACGFADTPSVILTLARTGSIESGARGLSFFLVNSNDVHIANIEKKLGLHCSPTCEVVYENSPGILLGKEGYGLVKYAIGMMNGARMAVAAQSMGVAEAAFQEANKYANEREQFGKHIKDIPAVRKMLQRMKREIIAMRCLLYEATLSVDLSNPKIRAEKKDIAIDELFNGNQSLKWEKLANFFTPLAKYYLSEMCNTLAYDALQIHGGSGYTEEYDVARIYRDARITNIYEGTTQLQIVAAIGGVTAGMTSTGFLKNYIDEELKKIKPTEELLEIYKEFLEMVEFFKNIKDVPTRDELAFELVHSGARLILGLLSERSLLNTENQDKQERSDLINEFNLESLAILADHKMRLKLFSKKLNNTNNIILKTA